MVGANSVEHHIGEVFLEFILRTSVGVPLDAVDEVLRVGAVLLGVRLGGGEGAGVFAHKKEFLAAEIGLLEGLFIAGN